MIWFDAPTIKNGWTPSPPVGRGKPGLYSALAIQTCHRGSTLHSDFRPFSEGVSSAGAGLAPAAVKALWWHVCNSYPQA